MYNPDLLSKQRILAISKTDMLDEELELLEELKKTIPSDIPVVLFSSVSQKNLMELKDVIWEKLSK
jgi:GTP-binding protein